ncbi:MAG: DNA alkylation repair protein [Akkermansiaceae bacterium]
MTVSTTHYLMKDGLGELAVEKIIQALLNSGAQFPPEAFRKDALSSLHNLELKERVTHLIMVMHRYLPSSFPETAKILAEIRKHWVGADNPREDKPTMFAAWPVIDYVAEHGLNHPDTSLLLLRDLTPLFSAEFAIRPFLNTHPVQTYNTMLLWCLDSDEHVRRLASEGIRPRLPWAKKLSQFIKDPSRVLSLLDSLKDDPSDYVRRSVANNLNDISKDHPDLVIETCERWLLEKVSARQWIVRHATRTLVKAGYPAVFPLLGYSSQPRIEIEALRLSHNLVRLGETLVFNTVVTSVKSDPQKIVIDYAIHYMKANGQLARKVFKWKNLLLQPHQSVSLTKSHSFNIISTRTHYAGNHHVEVLVNGQSLKPVAWSQFQIFIE